MKFPKTPNGPSPMGEAAVRAHRENPRPPYLTTTKRVGDQTIKAHRQGAFERVRVFEDEPVPENYPGWVVYGYLTSAWPYNRDYVLLGAMTERSTFRARYAAPYRNTFPEDITPSTGFPQGSYEVEYGMGLLPLGGGKIIIVSLEAFIDGGGIFFDNYRDGRVLSVAVPPGGYARRVILVSPIRDLAFYRNPWLADSVMGTTALKGDPGPEGGFVPRRTVWSVVRIRNTFDGTPTQENTTYAILASRDDGRTWESRAFRPPMESLEYPKFYGLLGGVHAISATEVLVLFVGVQLASSTLNYDMGGYNDPHGFFHAWDLRTLTRRDFAMGDMLPAGMHSASRWSHADATGFLGNGTRQSIVDALVSLAVLPCPATGDLLFMTRADSYDLTFSDTRTIYTDDGHGDVDEMDMWYMSRAEISVAARRVAVFRSAGGSPVREATLVAPYPVAKLVSCHVGEEMVFRAIPVVDSLEVAEPPNAAFFVGDANGANWRLIEIPHPCCYVGEFYATRDALYFTVYDPSAQVYRVVFTRRTTLVMLGEVFEDGGIIAEDASPPPTTAGVSVSVGGTYLDMADWWDYGTQHYDPTFYERGTKEMNFYHGVMANFAQLRQVRADGGVPTHIADGAPWFLDERRRAPWEDEL